MERRRKNGIQCIILLPDLNLRRETLEEFQNEFKLNPNNILAQQYDLVLNGYEVGGGSIRISEPELLETIFEF